MHHLWELVHFKNPTLYLNVVTLSDDGVLYIAVECLCGVLGALEGSTLPSWTCLSDLRSYLTRSSDRVSPPQLQNVHVPVRVQVHQSQKTPLFWSFQSLHFFGLSKTAPLLVRT